jgi:hypothetical protein
MTALLLTAAACARAPTPPPNPPPPPVPSVSLYVRTTNPIVLRGLGCDEGRRLAASRAPTAVVVLAFGKPVRAGKELGVSGFGPGLVSLDQVHDLALAYVRGYVGCTGVGGAAPPPPRLTAAIGTSNYGHDVSFAHGRAWAELVNRASDDLGAAGLLDRVAVAGASDLEPGWNDPLTTRGWVDGYGSVARFPFYDVGDALHCPPVGACHGRWTMEDLWYVAWGAPFARPLPIIYSEDGVMAQQWYRLSLYGFVRHGDPMRIAGAVSQTRACADTTTSCEGLTNSAAQAWTQLWRALHRDRRTAQPVPWSTDFDYTPAG